jgi:hypothetical protein
MDRLLAAVAQDAIATGFGWGIGYVGLGPQWRLSAYKGHWLSGCKNQPDLMPAGMAKVEAPHGGSKFVLQDTWQWRTWMAVVSLSCTAGFVHAKACRAMSQIEAHMQSGVRMTLFDDDLCGHRTAACSSFTR